MNSKNLLKIENCKLKIIVPIFSLCFSFLAINHVYAQDITSGLVGHWKFDEGSGTTASDSSGNSNTGTLVNSPTWTLAPSNGGDGKIGGALSFDGVDDYVEMGNPFSLQLTGSMTLSAWINGDVFGTNDIISKKGGLTDRGWEFLIDFVPKKFDIAIANSSNGVIDRRSNTTPAIGQWYHVVAVYNASATTLDVYVDGTLDNGVLTGVVPASQRNSTRDITIGRRPGAGSRWDGLIDDVRIYNRALTSADVQTLYNLGSGGGGDTIPPVRSSGSPSGALPTGTISATLSLSTNENATCRYSTTAGTAYSSMTPPAGGTFSTTGGTSHSTTVTGLTNGASYNYYVRCQDTVGNANTSDYIISFSIASAIDIIPPSIPTNLTATVISSSQINLSWTASTDNIGVTGYRVERCQSSTCTNFVQIATPSTNSYSDTGLTANTAYRYQVRATDAAGNPSTSTIAEATTQLPLAFDFTLSNGGARSVTQGQSTTNTITATLVSGTAQSVSFSASGLPTGASSSFSPASCSPTCSSTLTISTQTSTPTGSYTIIVTAINGSISRTTSFALTVTQPSTSIWTPPIGIPAPPFGINESHTMYTGQPGYLDAGNGPYTHYVDRTASNCSDTGNGTATIPRCTIPTSLSAGAVVEVHGGIYAPAQVISGTGTVAQPIFVRGANATNRPEIRVRWQVNGTYMIFENLLMTQGIGESGIEAHFESHHISIRHGEFSGLGNNLGNGSIVRASGTNPSNPVRYVVMYDNYIHNIGDSSPSAPQNDMIGASVSRNARDVWILDNHIHNMGADAVQMKETAWVYVGRNELHNDGENAIDIKGEVSINNVIISQNKMYGYRTPVGGNSDGSAIAAHSCSDVGPDCGNAWIIYNECFDSERCIHITGNNNVRVIGNIVHDNTVGPGYGIRLRSSNIGYVLNNIVYNSKECYRGEVTIAVHFINNIGINCSVSHAVSQRSGSSASNNIWFQQGGVVNTSLNDGCSNCTVADPKFINYPANLHYQVDSPAINAGTADLATHNAVFQSIYGPLVSILVDYDKNLRPQGSAYDIGAYEYVSTTPPPTPLLGDLNADRTVNGADWSLMSAVWFTPLQPADINNDGVVNSIDFSFMNQNWGRTI